MGNHNYDESHIIRFLRNEMESEEKETFEKTLAESADLQRELAFHQQLMKGLDLNLREETKSYLQAFEKKEPSGIKKQRMGVSGLIKVASILIALFGSGLIVYMAFFQDPDNKAIAASHFQPYPNHLTNITRGDNQEGSSNYIDKAMRYYSGEEYGKAISLFKKAIDRDKAKGLATFYLGNAYLASGKSEKAIQTLEGADESLPSDYEVKNEWYLALAYLSNGQEKNALMHINKVCEKGNDFYCQKGQRIKKLIQ